MENTMRKFHDGTDCGKVRTCNMRIFSRNMKRALKSSLFGLLLAAAVAVQAFEMCIRDRPFPV